MKTMQLSQFGELFNFKNSSHYYGDIVRKLFVIAGVLMLFLLPFFSDRIPVSVYAALFSVIVLELVAGFTNPLQKWTVVIDMGTSVTGLMVMGYFAVESYVLYSAKDFYFWANQVLALIFLIAFYYSIKSVRGALLQNLSEKV